MIPSAEWQRAVSEEAWLARNSVVVGSVSIGPGSSVWYSAVLRGDGEPIVIGRNSNVQDGVVVHTDPCFSVRIGNGVSVGHNAVLHGCAVEDDVLVGMAAVIMNGAVVGAESVVAAGALIPEGMVVPPGSLVVGVPARVARHTRPLERDAIRRNAEEYRRLASEHRRATEATLG